MAMTFMGDIFTILGVIIGFVWIGIGSEIGKETYNTLLKEKTIKILNHIKEVRAKKLIQKIINKQEIEGKEKTL